MTKPNEVKSRSSSIQKSIRLCALNAIPQNSTNGFLLQSDRGRYGVMVIRREAESLFIYVNSCPHIGTPLDLRPGNFLNRDKTYILCSTHGALFRIEDGYCVSGPCAGEHLIALPWELRGNEVFITEPAFTK
ncbi:MAG: hypothetical protein CBB68_06340 [Rhodospirillaceae bacterium TMED8]|nr:(2Fe-2S)-binding protein [Magnetovibrio sp.]OUT51238.1 MAG: hypothetical protein CBB68_06340 [Rhodospirillaceae bacterium TMED8]|tara:strand:- start:102 stop:497 length:396 start_codon:yes stop_codon:yes gene_type:complete